MSDPRRATVKEVLQGMMLPEIDQEMPVYGYVDNGKEAIVFDIINLAVQMGDEGIPTSYLLILGQPESFDLESGKRLESGVLLLESWEGEE